MELLKWLDSHRDVYVEFGDGFDKGFQVVMRKYLHDKYAEVSELLYANDLELHGSDWVLNMLDYMRKEIDRVPVGALKERSE